ncbi:MAG: hypothetical protein K0U47_00195 [Epsilonproteobacteria bacterium]|nr:hypothetical protein [Campylobacterota bacterium]
MKKWLLLLLISVTFMYGSDNFAGNVTDGKVSAYLRGTLQDVKSVEAKLNEGGFTILDSTVLDKKESLTTITFTNDTLLSMADKKERGFMATLRILIDQENNQTTITNPLYFAKAFMQDNFDEASAQVLLQKMNVLFPNLKASTDSLKYKKIDGYHFMMGMPYYEDMITVAKGDSSQALFEKLQNKDDGKKLLFSKILSKDRILVGVKLGKKTSKFIKKIGVNNAVLLPYPLLIENGEAKILAPKYYIALSYPLLKMTQFMKISTVPGAIEKDCEKLFK